MNCPYEVMIQGLHRAGEYLKYCDLSQMYIVVEVVNLKKV